MGWIPDLPDHRDYMLSRIEQPLEAVPLVVSGLSRAIDRYDQLWIGSCTGQAAGRIFKFVDIKQGGLNIEPSRLQIYYDARKMRGWEQIDSGAYIRDAMSVIKDIGAAPETLWPYDPNKYNVAPPPEAYTEASKHQTIAYMRVDHNLSAMESCIASGYPFIIGATLYENFAPDAFGRIPMPSGDVIGGHAFCVDGYNRNTRYFECANSWGMNWGDSGYFYMPYDYLLNNNLAADLWTIRSVEEEFVAPPPPPPPPPPPTDFVQFDGVVNKANDRKVVVTPDAPVLNNITGRTVKVTVDSISFNGKIKEMEPTWIRIKPANFSPEWGLVGSRVHVETI